MISKIKELVLICCALLLMLPACIPEPTMYVASNGTRYIDLSGTYIASTGGSGSANSTIHGGIIGRMAVFDNTTSITSATNTDAQVSSAVTLKHTQGTDTTLGVQVAPINMGIHKIVSLAAPSDNTDAATVKYVIDNAGTGPAGPVGPAGPAGANGLNGTNGTNGATGPAGPNYISSNTTTSFIGFLYGLSGNVTTQAENLTGRGTSAYLTKWSGASTIVSATNTDSDVSDAVTKKHTQGTDTTLGTQTSDLNMGTKAITNVGTVDGVDVSGHASRHQWLGADPVNIIKLWLTSPVVGISPLDGFTSTPSGTGSGYGTGVDFYIATGATNTSSMGYVAWAYSLWHEYEYTNPNYRYVSYYRINANTNTDHEEAWVGWFSDTTTFPTTISKHYGVKLVSTTASNGILSASNGDGSGETATILLNPVVYGGTVDILTIYDYSSITYYFSTDAGMTWTLGAIHTTNRPTDSGLSFGGWIKNYAAANHAIIIFYPKIAGGVN